jgi:hypothetical protein
MVFALAASVIQAKSPVYQSDIFYEISQGNIKAVKAWVKLKPDLSLKNAQGQTVLHAAVFAGNRNMVKILVKAGVEVNALDNAGKTALDLSVEQGYEKLIFHLVKKKAQVSNHANLIQVQALISDYNKKIIRCFFIMLPIMLLIGIPAVASVIFAMMCGPHAGFGLTFFANLFFWGYPPAIIYTLTLPMQVSSWKIRSNRLQIVN